MATKSKKKGAKLSAEEAELRAVRRDNIRWITGFALIAAGIYIVCSIVSFFFYWREDMSAIAMRAANNPLYTPIFNNVCGSMGAKISMMLVGRGFGVFAIVVPIYLLVMGWRLFRSKELRMLYITISSALILILGSLTLAFAFGTKWALYGSGLGGAYGLALDNVLVSNMGVVGTLLVIVAGWILTGLFINRNFLSRVDTAGEHVAGGVAATASWFWSKFKREKSEEEDDEETTPEPQEGEKVGGDVASQLEDIGVVPPSVAVAMAAQAGKTASAEQKSEPQPQSQPQSQPQPQPAAEQPAGQGNSPFTAVPRGTEVAVDNGGNMVVDTPLPVEQQPVDDYPFKDPCAPLEEPLTEEQLQMLQAQQQGAQTESVANPNSPFMAVPRTSNETTQQVVPQQVEPQPTMPQPEIKEDLQEGMVITVAAPVPETLPVDSIHNDVYDPMRDLYSYVPPQPTLLTDHKSVAVANDQEIFENKERIRETLLNFGIPIRSMHATVGPTVTLYEIVQEQGVKISKIQGLENDIAQSLKALGIRIIAPIPGRGTIGIEVPNHTKQTVSMYSAICSREFQESKAQLPVVIGRTIQNENYTFDLAKMPHLLVAGATGQGKSVGLNVIITSLLYRKHPAELKFVLIDPKMVEFSPFSKIEKHFLAKMESEDEAIITDPRKAVYTLNSLCVEMENRLELCKQAHTRNIVEYNDKFISRHLNPDNGHRFLPYIVVIIDEFADLIMTAKEVEAPVMRLAQKARAVGIHLIVATQRPDVRVITGGIKANFPARIAFRVMQMTDSRTIIDQPGANQLIGRGDMLLSNGGELTRIQCAFVDTPEVERIVDHIGRQQGYASAYALPDYSPEQGGGEAVPNFGSEESGAPQKYDPKFGEIAREAVTSGMISTSMIQRNFEVGFNRAGRIMLQLERAGIVGPQIGSKPREIKYYDLASLEARLQELGVF